MKKLAALFMVFLMILNICACKRVPEDTEGVSIPASSGEEKTEDNGNDALSPTPPVGQEDTAPEKPEEDEGKKTDEEMQEKPADKTDDKVPTDTPDTEEDFTLDVPFSEYEVVVTLTDEESAKNKIYTPDDFPELELINVFEDKEFHYTRYYYSPEKNIYSGKKTLILMLKEPSKERVLKYIKLLQADVRVFDAYPNIDDIISYGLFWLYIDGEYNDGMFPELIGKNYTAYDLGYGDPDIPEYRDVRFHMEYPYLEQDEFYKMIYKILDNEKVFCGRFTYSHRSYCSFYIELDEPEKPLDEYSKSDFPDLNVKRIYKSKYAPGHENHLTVEFEEIDIRNLFKMYRALSKDKRIKDVLYKHEGLTIVP